jgi:hypothetical protein
MPEVDLEVSEREAVMADDERIKTPEVLERRLLAFGIETAGVSKRHNLRSRPSDLR